MKRLGNLFLILTISCLAFLTVNSSALAIPTWAPKMKLPNDTTILLCETDSICYDIVVTDPDADESLYLTLLEGGIDYPTKKFSDDFTETVCFYPDTAGVYRFIWKVTDKYNQVTKDTVIFTVVLNHPPEISDQSFAREFCYETQTRDLPVEAFDPDGESLTFELLSGPGMIDAATGVITYDPDTAGVYEFHVAVSDQCASDTATILDSITVNQPPALDTHEFSFELCAPEELCIDVVGVDPEGGPVTITQIEGPGQTTLVTDSSGQTCFMPDNVASATYMFVYCLTDVCPLDGQSGDGLPPTPPCFRDTVWVRVYIDQPPVIVCPDPQTFYTCDVDTFCFDIDATDPESGELTFNVLSGNATIDGRTVCVEGSESSQFDVVLEVVDSCGNADTCTVPVTIDGNRPPVVTMPADYSLSLCQIEPICFEASVSDPDNDIAEITLNYGTFDANTDQVCFDADTSGVYTIVLSATDSCGVMDADTTVVTVDVNGTPVVNLGPDFDRLLCDLEQICFDATITDDDTEVYSLNFGSYDPSSGQICFTPDTSGTYTIIASITDACEITVADTVVIGVDLRGPPVISGLNDTSVYICNPEYVCLPVDITDPDNDISSITVNRGTYKDGEICFVPYNGQDYTIIVTVADSCGNVVADTAMVHVTTDQDVALECPGDTSIFLCEPDTLCFPVSGIPDNATVSVSGTAAWWDAETQSVCFYSDCCVQNVLTVSATTRCGTYSCSFTVNVQTNSKPLVILSQDTTVSFCGSDELCLPVGVNDIDDNLVDVQVVGATYDSYRNLLCLTPDTAGTYMVTVTATDDCGAVDMDQVAVTVNFNQPPVITYVPSDTIYQQCELSEICVPLTIVDPESNLDVVSSSAGQLTNQGTSWTLCFTPPAFGDYCVSVIATDSCGAADTVDVCVTVNPGEQVSIECPEPSPYQLCAPEDICIPINITGQNYTVTTSFGSYADGSLCFFADTNGVYEITVIAEAECNTDTCIISVPVGIIEPVEITCPADTSLFLCGPDTVELPYTVTGPMYDVQVTEPAYIQEGRLFVPVLSEEDMQITMVAFGECGSDTCSFKVFATFNRPPTITIRDSSLTLCELDEICLPYEISDYDNNIASMSPSIGTLDQGLLCFMPTQYGDYDIVVTVVDSCGADAVDTVHVTVNEGDFVSIACPGTQVGTMCGMGEMCFPLEITGTNYEVSTDYGYYQDGNLCFEVDTSGTYSIRVIATAGCNADTCDIAFDITVTNPIDMICNVSDTSVFYCDGSDTLSFPVTVTGDNIQITTQPEGTWYDGGRVYLPLFETGSFNVKVIASNECNVDTCSFVVDAEFNAPPVLIAPDDTSLVTCELNPICIPFSLTDVNDNIVEVRATLGIVNDTILCFTPGDFGDYDIILSAKDSCGLTVKDTINVSVTQGEFAAIDCPASPIPVSVETPDTVRIPLGITPAGAEITVSPFGYYDAQAGEVVAYIETPGQYTFEVTAAAFCNVDTCQFTIDVTQYFPPLVSCVGSVDTVLCVTSPTTLCTPVTISGTNVQVAVDPIGEYADGNVCVPVDTSGEYVIRIIAFNDIEADTCYSTLYVGAGDPPMVQLPNDTTLSLCEPQQLCLPVSLTSADFGVASISTNYGTYDELTGELCVDIDTTGTYTIIAGVTDSCGLYDEDTIVVTADINVPPVVDLGDDRSIKLCGLEQVCVDVSITDDNVADVTTSFGTYDPRTGQVCFVPEVSSQYTIILTATDECGASDADTVNITVDQNRLPTIDPMSDTSVYICYPKYICLPVSFNDPDNDIASVTVNRGKYEDGNVCFVPYDSGHYNIILTVTDSCGATAVDTAVVTVMTDQAIALECPGDTSLFLCEPDTLCFPIGGIPDGATVTVSGTAAWWDEENQTACFYSDCCVDNKITVQATTECGTYSCSFNVHVQTNSKPLVIIPQDTSIIQCELSQICIPVGVNDIDNNLETVTVDGASYDAYRNLACFTPEGSGSYTVTVTATDSCGAVDVDEMVIEVIENRDPAVSFTNTDSLFKQCEFEEICLPVEINDADGNLKDVTVSHGVFDVGNSQVCFLPDSFGVYCLTITASDMCGQSASDEVCVRVAAGDYVTIECPESPFENQPKCEAGTVCIPLKITGTNFSVTADVGEWTDGSLCFQADTSGLYSITVIAAAQCSADTCTVEVPVEILGPTAITCPDNQRVFLCEPDTLCYDFSVSSGVTGITVTAPAYINGSTVCVPVLQDDSLTIKLVAEGLCGTDSCEFYVVSDINSAPVVSAGPDFELVKCNFEEVCVPLTITDDDNNIASITSNIGTVRAEQNQVCFTPDHFGDYMIIVTVTDECDASDVDTVVVSYTEGAQASIMCPEDDQFASLCGPDTVCIIAPITPSDAEITVLPNGKYDAQTHEICVYATESGTIPVTVIAAAECGADTCNFNLQVEIGEPPAVSCPSQIDTMLCLSEPDTLCFPVSVTGTGVQVSVKPAGEYAAGFVCVPISSPGDYSVQIIATGVCGVDTCTTDITVDADQAPTLFVPAYRTVERCPNDTDHICIDSIFATDPESEVTVTQICGPGEFTALQPDSGYICFVPDTFGVYTFCVQADDGCQSVVDTVMVDVQLRADCEVCVRAYIDGGVCTPVGLRKIVAINLETNDAVAGFDILISYDASALSFMNATKAGSVIEAYEYFTYNLNNGACGGNCPSGIVRLVGIADINNGSAHPPDSVYTPQGPIAYIEFQVANDQNLGSQFLPINFVWYDCGDNTFSNPSGTLLYTDLRIFNAENILIWDEDDDVAYPSGSRPFGIGAPDECMTGTDKGQPYRCVEFYNGGICITPPEELDDRGDINLDGLAYTIADAVLFTRYFIYGFSAFTINIAGQTAATDVNADGITLSVSDLVYLIRVVVGDADPIPKPVPTAGDLQVSTTIESGHMDIITDAPETIGAAYFVYDLDPGLHIDDARLTEASAGMDIDYSVENNQLKLLVYNIGTGRIEPGHNCILELPCTGQGSARLVKTEAADYIGRPYKVLNGSETLPTGYSLNQNYPNPFNPSTNISFALPQPSDWTLNIYNIRGELVRRFTGSDGAGDVLIVWDGVSNRGEQVASGVYLYRLEAGSFVETRKMMLLK